MHEELSLIKVASNAHAKQHTSLKIHNSGHVVSFTDVTTCFVDWHATTDSCTNSHKIHAYDQS